LRVVTADQMRFLEGLAIKQYRIPSLDLMERAAEGLVRELTRVAISDTNVLILCGPGNNGGDGLAAARLLDEADYPVTALLSVEPNQLKGDALAQYRRLAETEVRLYTAGQKGYERTLQRMEDFDIVVDALLGTGSKGEPEGEILRLVQATNEAMAFIIAADIPTGIDCDTGIAEGSYVSANVTVTFGLPKPFLFQNEGLTAAGEWHVADIGLPDELVVDAGNAFLLDHWWASGTFPQRTRDSHKRSSGVVLVVGGCNTYPGAPTLAAMGALRAGAGLVTAASVRFAIEGVRSHLPECPLITLPEQDGFICPKAVKIIADAAESIDAIALGPGLGRAQCVGEFLDELWKSIETKWVIDADALYWLSELEATPRGQAVLTPHEGEAARLCNRPAEEIHRDRMGAATEVSDKFKQTVLLKGAYTVVASQEFDLAINPTGNPGLASGGTGDVLTGVVAAMLAQGVPPQGAAALGAFWHGGAADLLSERDGAELGFSASEVAAELPRTRAAIEAGLIGQPLGEDEDLAEEEEMDELEEI
jgi:hydroxyethylthiazole kinase-like uncharacterized protein yjeF